MIALGLLCAVLAADPPRDPGTAAMVKRLQALARAGDPWTPERGLPAAFLKYQALYGGRRDGAGQVVDAAVAAHAKLFSARTAEATRASIAAFDEVQKDAASTPGLGPDFRAAVSESLAIAYLRLGEQSNCFFHHNADSCLLPLQKGGVYALREGPEGAIRVLTALLTSRSVKDQYEDLQNRWLLNVAYMALGTYPDAVPTAWRIPPEVFRSSAQVPRFTDLAAKLGVNRAGLAGGVIAEDFDGDGFIDLMTSSQGLGPEDNLRLFHNDGDGTFSERTKEAGLTGLIGGLNLQQLDYDNDGRPDVLVGRGGWQGDSGKPQLLSLLHNNGDGTFSDVTERAGLLLAHPTQTLAVADFDGDGWVDLFVGYESGGPGGALGHGSRRQPCRLFRNNHDGTFTDVAKSAGVDLVGFVKGATWGDYDNDGRPDLYVSRLGEPNLLFHNDGPGPDGAFHFSEVSARAGVREPRMSFGTFFFDYDNDGWPDLFVEGVSPGQFNHAAGRVAAAYLGKASEPTARLFHNKGDGTFEDVTRAAGLTQPIFGMGLNFGDVDNDGFPDIYVGTGDPEYATLIPNLLFHNLGGRRFEDATFAAGVGHLQKGHGIAFADFDNDGDQDLYLVAGGAYPGDVFWAALFQNPGTSNHFLTLLLRGKKANSFGVGVRVHVTVEEAGKPRELYATLGSGGSFGASPLRIQLGLGQATAIRSVEITWPGSGTRQRFEQVALDRFYRATEGQVALEELSPKRLELGRKPAASK